MTAAASLSKVKSQKH